MQGKELDSMILVDSFQLSIFCDYGISHVWECWRVLLPAPSFAHTAQAPHQQVSCWLWALPVLVAPSRRSPAHAAPKCYHLTASDKPILKEEITTFHQVFFTVLRPPSLIQTHLLIKSTVPKYSLQSFLQPLHRKNNSGPMWCWY